MTYSLYLKISPKGLKYLGVTCRDPLKYKGSGKYWLRHLSYHRFSIKDIKTTVLFQTENIEELKIKCLYYSDRWNIAQSRDWANLMVEGGAAEYTLRRFEIMKQLGKTNKGRKHSDEFKEKCRKRVLGTKRDKKAIEATILKCSKTVYQYDSNGNFIQEWVNSKLISDTLKTTRAHISSCCNYKRKSAAGFQWRYQKEEKIPPIKLKNK